MTTSRRIGLILAAGRGRRMGRTKQLMPWRNAGGEKPLVAAAYDAIRPICDDMIVVLGHDADAAAAALGARSFQRADSDADAPMFESIRAGLTIAQTIDPNALVVLQPGDHPEVSQTTLNTLTTRSLQRPAKAIIPEYVGRGGHPILIPPQVAARLLALNCPEGLGQFWADHPELCRRVPVDDPSILRDIDTPTDLDP
jgi:molybdenum cofactor cytidylyltransferase